jgi:hypothetical protein
MNPNNGPLKFLWRRGGGWFGVGAVVVALIAVMVLEALR